MRFSGSAVFFILLSISQPSFASMAFIRTCLSFLNNEAPNGSFDQRRIHFEIMTKVPPDTTTLNEYRRWHIEANGDYSGSRAFTKQDPENLRAGPSFSRLTVDNTGKILVTDFPIQIGKAMEKVDVVRRIQQFAVALHRTKSQTNGETPLAELPKLSFGNPERIFMTMPQQSKFSYLLLDNIHRDPETDPSVALGELTSEERKNLRTWLAVAFNGPAVFVPYIQTRTGRVDFNEIIPY